ncbi:zinc finger B-box domain-containing protein 1 [Megalops cyprinoides]|uniref:zinc finger B-box domain-containing protein 1 n=1 Tax=Megalops cyprinoides TaxID=118141 RepID=UPI001863A393|nr:zinc finger B-box domain-containing protein 1 [Megalops cyprinoides]
MNLNYFVVIPNKSTSVKLKARNLPELHLDAVKLDQESKIIENRLQQLRENMSREKEEREKSGGFRWKSVLAASHGPTKIKENGLQKRSAGKVKMRVLKDAPEDASRSLGKVPRPPPKEPAPSTKPRLKGKPCGQCEARTARLMCPECGENYCVGCFARFHQKGALKNHRMIPIQMEIQTSINTLDLVSRFRKQIDPEGSAVGTKRKDPTHSQEAQKSNPPPVILPDAQLLGFDDEETDEEKEEEEEDESEPDERAHSPALLRGVFDEEESKRSFQDALREWRRKRGAAQSQPEQEQEQEQEPKPELDLVPELKPQQEQKQELELKEDPEPDFELEQAGRPIKAPTAPTEVFGTQADYQATQQPITVEFKEHGLSYMEKLMLKKHRRTPIEEYRLPSFAGSYQELQMDTSRLTDEEGPGLTAEEMEMRRYCASLFAATTTPANSSDQHDHMTQSCLSIVELDER